MAAPMEESQFASGGLVKAPIEDIVLGICSEEFTAKLDDLIINGDQLSGTVSSDPSGIMSSTTDSVSVTTSDNHTTGGDIQINTTYEGTMDFQLTEEEMARFMEFINPYREAPFKDISLVEKKRVIPKHRMIRED